MLGIEEVIKNGRTEGDEENYNGNKEMMKDGLLPPGFRFHPTDEELISFYLASKLFKPSNFYGVHIVEVDLNRCEPWELPEEAKMGEREWYFFSLRVRKYPTGLRTNRATVAGYWKATGKDRQVYSSATTTNSNIIKLGTKKTLVFYKGGAPRGVKTKWVMHEFRLHSDLISSPNLCKDEWVLCRIIHKSGEKIKTRSFQQQTSYMNKEVSFPALSSVVPSPISSVPRQTIIDHHNNNVNQFQRHENGVFDSNNFILNNYPQLIFQSNLDIITTTTTHFSPPTINAAAHFHPHFNPPFFLDAASTAASGSRDSCGAFGDVADYSGGHCESEENWSGGC